MKQVLQLSVLSLFAFSCSYIEQNDKKIHDYISAAIEAELQKEEFEKLDSLEIISVDALSNQEIADSLIKRRTFLLDKLSENIWLYGNNAKKDKNLFDRFVSLFGKNNEESEKAYKMYAFDIKHVDSCTKKKIELKKKIDRVKRDYSLADPKKLGGFLVTASYFIVSKIKASEHIKRNFIIDGKWKVD